MELDFILNLVNNEASTLIFILKDFVVCSMLSKQLNNET